MKQKINNIQALRALAAVAVAIFHTNIVLPHLHPVGSFGVDIFFVISGYIMARICETNSSYFLRRRLIRIIPPYWAMTLLLFVFAYCIPDLLVVTRANFTELVKSLCFIPYSRSDGEMQPVLFVGWSLNYEMFFYLVLSAGLFLVPRRPLLFASAVLLSLAIVCHPFAGRSVLVNFYSDKIVLEFVLGMIAYEIARRVPESFARRSRAFALAALVLSILCLAAYQAVMPENTLLRGKLVESLSLLVVLSASLMSQGGWDTDLGWLVLIGDASYILYLVHPFCESLLARIVAPRAPLLDITRPLGATIAITLSLLVAITLHLSIERPVVTFLNRRFGGRRKSVEFRGEQAAPEQVAP